MRDFIEDAAKAAASLRTLGLDVAQVVVHSISRRHENWRVDLNDGSSRLLRLPLDRTARSLRYEAAALRRLSTCEIPVVGTYRRVDDAFGRPAVLSAWIDGADGLGVLDAHPEVLPQLCRLMGECRLELEHQTVGPFGVEVLDGGFVESRSNWASAYLSMVYDHHRTAERAGISLGPEGDRLLRLITAAAPVLATVVKGCLVHGDLRPVNFVVELNRAKEKNEAPIVELRGVVDWEFARMADPLLGWALPLELPVDALAHVIAGYGREQVEAWMTDDAVLTRLDVYSMGRVLQYLAEVLPPRLSDDLHWEHGLCYASRMAQERVPGFAKAKLQQALDLELPDTLEPVDWQVPDRAMVWRAIYRLSLRPGLEPDQQQSWMAGLAGALRHRAHPDEGWATEARNHLELLVFDAPRGFEPIGDRSRWLNGLDEYLRHRRADLALSMLWLGIRGLRMLAQHDAPQRWMVQDDVLRGLQTLVETAARRPVGNDPRQVLLHNALGLAAEAELASMLGRELDREQQNQRRDRIRDAWEDLTVFQGHVPDDTIEQGTWIVPVLLLAVDALQGLPMRPGELIHAIATR